MPVRIFISSVSVEFDAERRAIEEEIRKLQQVFVGMEYFGSDRRGAADFDAGAVATSDVYVGLLGSRYGSIEPASGRSYTELEYDAAGSLHVPRLIYFSEATWPPQRSLPGADERLIAFRRRAGADQLAEPFASPDQLRIGFLRGLFKLLAGPLADKLTVVGGHQISASVLHAACQAVLPAQVVAVGGDRYVPAALFVGRAADARVDEFVRSEEAFKERSAPVLDRLDTIAGKFDLPGAAQAVAAARRAVRGSGGPAAVAAALGELKRAYQFDAVERVHTMILTIMAEPSAAGDARGLYGTLSQLPFARNADLQRFLINLATSRKSYQAGNTEVLQAGVHIAVLGVLPSVMHENRLALGNDLIKDFGALADAAAPPCLAIVDAAGRGKTNVLCRVAERLAARHPVLLLSGSMKPAADFGLRHQVTDVLEGVLRGVFSDWLERVGDGLRATGQWLYLLIDGINESGDTRLMMQQLREFLPRVVGKRVRLIVTCRDVHWDPFLRVLRPSLFGREPVGIGEFSDTEGDAATEQYFDRYRIKCRLGPDARRMLRHPLVLRLFCDAHGAVSGGPPRELGTIDRLHDLRVFEEYVRRAEENVAARVEPALERPAKAFLCGLAARLWDAQAPAVLLSKTDVSSTEAVAPRSVYTLLREEGGIAERPISRHGVEREVCFTYDEVCEFLLACHWTDSVKLAAHRDAEVSRIVAAAAGAAAAFPQAIGALIDLDKLLDHGGTLATRLVSAISIGSPELMGTRQEAMLLAFSSARPSRTDDEFFDALVRFEELARPEIKVRLLQACLRLIGTHPSHPALQRLTGRVLEAGPPPAAAVSGKGKTKRQPSRSGRPSDSQAPSGPADEKKAGEVVDVLGALPRATFHYPEAVRLSAIALLASSRDESHLRMIEDGIRGLGRMELFGALSALSSLNECGDDQFVFRMIDKYGSAAQPEYRIHCAQLLANRYGSAAAAVLAKLLCDDATRVHRHVYKLLGVRGLEAELVDELVAVLHGRQGQIHPWHLANMVKLLGRPELIQPSAAELCGAAVCDALQSHLTHPRAVIRVEAYLGLLARPERVDVLSLRHRASQDEDPRIRALSSDA